MGVTAGILLALIILKEMRYLVYIDTYGSLSLKAKLNCIVGKSLKIIKLLNYKNAVRFILDNFGIGRIPVDSSHFSLHSDSIVSPKVPKDFILYF